VGPSQQLRITVTLCLRRLHLCPMMPVVSSLTRKALPTTSKVMRSPIAMTPHPKIQCRQEPSKRGMSTTRVLMLETCQATYTSNISSLRPYNQRGMLTIITRMVGGTFKGAHKALTTRHSVSSMQTQVYYPAEGMRGRPR
jgi:hypothetical protein